MTEMTEMCRYFGHFCVNEQMRGRYAKRALRNEESDWDEMSQSQGSRLMKSLKKVMKKICRKSPPQG